MQDHDLRDKAASIIEKVFDLLDEGRMEVIDQRIDGAFTSLEIALREPLDHGQFHRAITELIQGVYKHGLRVPQDLTEAQARAEAIHLLERYYQGAHANGYDAAYLDARTPGHDGIQIVLERMVEIVKAIERQKYIRCVFVTCIDSSSWEIKCQIVEMLQGRWRQFLSPAILQCAPAELVCEIPSLIVTFHSAEAMANKIASGDALFLSN